MLEGIPHFQMRKLADREVLKHYLDITQLLREGVGA